MLFSVLMHGDDYTSILDVTGCDWMAEAFNPTVRTLAYGALVDILVSY